MKKICGENLGVAASKSGLYISWMLIADCLGSQ